MQLAAIAEILLQQNQTNSPRTSLSKVKCANLSDIREEFAWGRLKQKKNIFNLHSGVASCLFLCLKPTDCNKKKQIKIKTKMKEINMADQASFRMQFEKSTWLADAVGVCLPSAWKPASVHEMRMTLNRVPFSTSQIKVYWRPKWEGEVAMATSVKRASDLTWNQSINLWFLSCLIKKVCMWLIVNFWEYRRLLEVYLSPSDWKIPVELCHFPDLTKGTGTRTDSTLVGGREKLLCLWKKGVGETLENPCGSANDLLPSQILFVSGRVATMQLWGIQSSSH